MAEPRDTLILLTRSYPFGVRSETFLDSELPVLARRFARVLVMPSHRELSSRTLPVGAECMPLLADCGRGDILRALLRSPRRAVTQYARAILDEGAARAYVLHPRVFFGVIGANLHKSALLRDFVLREGLGDAVFYDYWLDNSALALSYLRRHGIIHRAVARTHGVDLYDERAQAEAVPFRAFILASLDRVVAISAHGLAYLTAKHPWAQEKLALSRLGVETPVLRPRPLAKGGMPPLIVSCASLTPIKRIDIIPEVLGRIGRRIRWVHFGDGPEREKVELAAANLPRSVDWQLVGHVARSEVIDFYRRNTVDLFLSLSASEGLPVSMMEAISFGIPVLATDVGGVSEIVNSDTGRLVGIGDSSAAIAAAALALLDGGRPSPEETIAFFESHFDAEKNFGEFADLLQSL